MDRTSFASVSITASSSTSFAGWVGNYEYVKPDEEKNNYVPTTAIYSGSVTHVIWQDGHKTSVRCLPGDIYSRSGGVALCVSHKLFGSKKAFSTFIDDIRFCPNNRYLKFIYSGLPEIVKDKIFPTVDNFRKFVSEYKKYTSTTAFAPFEIAIRFFGKEDAFYGFCIKGKEQLSRDEEAMRQEKKGKGEFPF